MAREQQFVYDAAGREVGRRVGPSSSISSAPWQCISYDVQGRITSESWPATSTAPARTVTYAYGVGGNPLVSSVTDASGTITSTVDLLGRSASYTDAKGNTSTTTYNQAAQATGVSVNGGAVALTDTYDPTSARLSTVSVNGTQYASAGYDSDGRLQTVTYGNGTTATLGYDPNGSENSLNFTETSSGTFLAGNQVALDPAGRITAELEDINGTSLSNPAGGTSLSTSDYTYDGSGRLASAVLPGDTTTTYGYATNTSCTDAGLGENQNAGENTNRSTVSGATATSYCYNDADQLVSSTTSGTTSTSYSYDSHGNQTDDNATTLTWDSSDRLQSVTTPAGQTTTYTYDALNRVIEQQSPTSDITYSYAGLSDSPSAAYNNLTATTKYLIALPGGVTASYDLTPNDNIWSYPDLHGNYTVTANNSGTRQGSPALYDPWGQLIPGDTAPANTGGNTSLGAFGADGKITDTETDITLMGARGYNSAEARFLSVDPIEGGCADNYTYSFGDPLGQPDLTGQGGCSKVDDQKLGTAVLGLVLGAASGGLGAVALAADGTEALAYGIAAEATGTAAEALDVKTCVHSRGKDIAACTSTVLGAVGLISGLPGAVMSPSANSGADAALKYLGGISDSLGFTSLFTDVTVGLGGLVCGIGGWLGGWARGLNRALGGN